MNLESQVVSWVLRGSQLRGVRRGLKGDSKGLSVISEVLREFKGVANPMLCFETTYLVVDFTVNDGSFPFFLDILLLDLQFASNPSTPSLSNNLPLIKSFDIPHTLTT